MKAVRLRTEYLMEPMGLGIRSPRFFWNCEDGIKQTAYQIIAKRGTDIVWNSGKVNSDEMTHIRYQGKELNSRDIVSWEVCLWDEEDRRGETSESRFEMGLLNPSDWTAKWISGDYHPSGKERYPADCFCRQFQIPGNLVKARLYATARGVYDVWINGKCLEDFILSPGMTDYRRRIQYQVYDVTDMLISSGNHGEHRMEIRLADGWFRGSVAAYGVTNVFGTQTSLLAQLELTDADGNMQKIVSDESWRWSNDGPVRFADLKDGEVYDASYTPSYSGKARVVKKSDITDDYRIGNKGPLLAASDNVPIREKERLKPMLLENTAGKRVLDFGQNIAGYLEFNVKGKAGAHIRLICGEVLDKNGCVDLSGIQETKPIKGWNNLNLVTKLLGKELKGDITYTPKQEISFYASGKMDYYKTSFAVFGFRYVQMEGSLEIKPENFTAIAVYSDMEQTGNFVCSDERINQLVENTRWSMKGNFLDLPTDCPTRERLGWTGDAQIFFHTGAYLMDTAAFFRKWLRDMKDDQYDNGLLSAVIPYQGVEMMYKSTGTSVGWADAVYLIPYRYYKRYGDLELLKNYWPMMKKYGDYLMTHLGMSSKKAAKKNPYNEYTYEKGVHLGEWLEPEKFRDKVYGAQAKHPEECTAYLYLTMTILAEIAELLEEIDYQKKCQKYADGARQAYEHIFVKTGTLDTNRQAKLVRPLAVGILQGEEKEKAQRRLVKAVENYDYCVGTGFLSTPFLLPVLTEAGELETAYHVLENTKKPGWLGEVLEGATTIWENWEGNLSQNHYSPGAVCEWLFDTIAGIRISERNCLTIVPKPGGKLRNVQAEYLSPYGKVISSWKRTGDSITYEIVVPANTVARVVLSRGREEMVGAGKHIFVEPITDESHKCKV